MHGYFIIYQVVTKVDVYGLRLANPAFNNAATAVRRLPAVPGTSSAPPLTPRR